jgi:UDP-N-acetylmuramyl pentapeptide phosphotransferase/UDP-N-acetylglucosamine-1-phosphate transferase
MLNIFITFIVSTILSYIFILIFQNLFYKLNIVDNPKKYGKKREPVVYSMGVIFFIVFFIVSYLFIEHNYKLYLLWLF